MSLAKIDFGETVDLLNKSELRDALREDAALRRAVSGVKSMDFFYNAAAIGANVNTYTIPAAPAGGYMWAVMNIGFELSAAGVTRLYKEGGAVPSATPIGGGRFVGQTASTIANSLTFSKGQLILRNGEHLIAFAPGAGFVLSVFMTVIEIPAERIGELLL
jgi:hypothetical protein